MADLSTRPVQKTADVRNILKVGVLLPAAPHCSIRNSLHLNMMPTGKIRGCSFCNEEYIGVNYISKVMAVQIVWRLLLLGTNKNS